MKGKNCEKYSQAVYAIFRIVIGLLIATHGAQKFGLIGDGNIGGFAGMFSFPIWLAAIVAGIELIGGLLVALGIITRIAATLDGIVMIGALAIVHIPKGLNPLTNGGELPLLFLVAFLVISAYGSGKFGVEKGLMKKELV